MARLLRTTMINFGILAGLAIAINLAAALLLDVKRLVVDPLLPDEADQEAAADPRAELPVYADRARARTIYAELFAMGFDYVPFVGWSRRPFRGATTTVNAEGDRAVPGSPSDTRSTLRFLGGSAMWGTGSDDAGTIPALVQTALPSVRVFNHAESGFTARQGLARLINLVNQERAIDVVVSYDGANDIVFLCRADVSINGHSRETQIRERMSRRDLEAERSPLATILQSSALLRAGAGATVELAEKLASRLAGGEESGAERRLSRCRDDPDYAQRVAQTLVANWGIARTLVDREGGRFLAVLQPVAFVGSPRIEHLSAKLLRNEFADDFMAVYPKVRTLVADLDWVIDLTQVFEDAPPVYVDFVHVTEQGNRLVADRILEALRAGGVI